MRQSLSVQHTIRSSAGGSSPVAGAAVALVAALVPAAVALVDQLGAQALLDHATAMYAPHGKVASAGLMYGVVYGIAAIDGVLWLLVLRSARSGRRWAAVYAAAVVVVGLGPASVLFGSREYGEQVFPALWGLLALLSPVAGVRAVVQLARRVED